MAYIGFTQVYKEGIVQVAKARAEGLGGKILNVGATGIGNVISRTATIGGSIGCDIEPTEDIDYCDISTQMPYQDHEFDVVFASHVLEHVKPSEAILALKEFQRIGQHVIVVIPSPIQPAFYVAKGHQSQIIKLSESSLSLRNNPIYNSVYENYTVEFDPAIVEVFQ